MARAFKKEYDYYRLKKDCLGLSKGAIFYHDKNNRKLGSIANGCLKLAWDADGNCLNCCGNTYILHACAIQDKEFLELVDTNEKLYIIKIMIDRVSEWMNDTENHSNTFVEGENTAYRRVLNYLNNIE